MAVINNEPTAENADAKIISLRHWRMNIEIHPGYALEDTNKDDRGKIMCHAHLKEKNEGAGFENQSKTPFEVPCIFALQKGRLSAKAQRGKAATKNKSEIN